MPVLLFFLAWIGHGYLLMLSLNVTYGRPFHRKILKAMRQAWGLLLVAGPPVFAWLVGFDLIELGRNALADGSFALPVTYAWCCLFAGVVVLPIVTLMRLLRRNPAVVLEERTRPWMSPRNWAIGRWAMASIASWRNCQSTISFASTSPRSRWRFRLPKAWDG